MRDEAVERVTSDLGDYQFESDSPAAGEPKGGHHINLYIYSRSSIINGIIGDEAGFPVTSNIENGLMFTSKTGNEILIFFNIPYR